MRRLTRFTLAACATVGATAGIALGAGAPTATTRPATNIAATTATLDATVSPNGNDTTYSFQYGPTAQYGAQTPVQGPIHGNANKSVSANVAGLTPSSTYHYRVVASSSAGSVTGADMTFATTAPGAPTGNALTIAANHGTVTFGRPTTIAGTLSGPSNSGVTVTLEENPAPYTGGFKSTGLTATTTSAGAYSIAVSPPQSTHYRVTAKPAKKTVTSAETAVRVRVRVTLRVGDLTPRRGQRVLFAGTVLPAHNGKLARIQRRTAAGTWRTVATTPLVAASPVGTTPRSKYAKRVRIASSGVYRVRVVPADGDHIAGVSGRKSLVVH
ncbi:MAG: hypothetical protein QOF12_1341 [Solirubrobacteraceae bacterium]|jgi:hypothetical protein|nr:hypothetical protein [Solirubrobacteraceae bacterium]